MPHVEYCVPVFLHRDQTSVEYPKTHWKIGGTFNPSPPPRTKTRAPVHDHPYFKLAVPYGVKFGTDLAIDFSPTSIGSL